MISGTNWNSQESGNEVESQKSTVPSFLIAVLIILQEVKGDRHKDKG